MRFLTEAAGLMHRFDPEAWPGPYTVIRIPIDAGRLERPDHLEHSSRSMYALSEREARELLAKLTALLAGMEAIELPVSGQG
jgi:hypothetical protein